MRLLHQAAIAFIPKVSKHNPLLLSLVCSSKSYPSRCEVKAFTLLSHVCTGPEGSKHETIKHYQSDRFTVPGKKAGRTHTKKFTLKTKGNFSPFHPPSAPLPHTDRPTDLLGWTHLLLPVCPLPVCLSPNHPCLPPCISFCFLFLIRTLSCAIYGTGHVNLLLHQPVIPDKLTHPVLICPQKFSDGCWPGWWGCVH